MGHRSGLSQPTSKIARPLPPDQAQRDRKEVRSGKNARIDDNRNIGSQCVSWLASPVVLRRIIFFCVEIPPLSSKRRESAMSGVPNPNRLRSGSASGIRCHALFSNATAVSRAADAFRSGKNTAKQVPLRPGCVLLRTRIQPPCLSTIPLVTHRPRPVPFSPFVVKNGSNILRRFSRETPGPLSAMKTRTPRLFGFLQSREAKTCNLIVPSGLKASSAFTTRLENTWVAWNREHTILSEERTKAKGIELTRALDLPRK